MKFWILMQFQMLLQSILYYVQLKVSGFKKCGQCHQTLIFSYGERQLSAYDLKM